MRYLNQSSENYWSFILWFDARPFILLFVYSSCQISFSINMKKTTNMLRYYSFSLSIYILGLYILAETTISQLELRTICCNQHAVHVLNLSTVATWYVSDSFDSIKERFAYSYIVSPKNKKSANPILGLWRCVHAKALKLSIEVVRFELTRWPFE